MLQGARLVARQSVRRNRGRGQECATQHDPCTDVGETQANTDPGQPSTENVSTNSMPLPRKLHKVQHKPEQMYPGQAWEHAYCGWKKFHFLLQFNCWKNVKVGTTYGHNLSSIEFSVLVPPTIRQLQAWIGNCRVVDSKSFISRFNSIAGNMPNLLPRICTISGSTNAALSNLFFDLVPWFRVQ